MTNKTKGTQKPWECEHCGKEGKNRANYRRDHGKRCPVYLKTRATYDQIYGFAGGVLAVMILWGLAEWVL